MNKQWILIMFIVGTLLITPISAKEMTSIVDDKRIQHSYLDDYYFVHTVDFGDIQVSSATYSEVMINDTITFDSDNEWGIWHIKVGFE